MFHCLCLVVVLWVVLLTQEGVFESVIATLCCLQTCCHISDTCPSLSMRDLQIRSNVFSIFFFANLKSIYWDSVLIFFITRECWNTVLISMIWVEVQSLNSVQKNICSHYQLNLPCRCKRVRKFSNSVLCSACLFNQSIPYIEIILPRALHSLKRSLAAIMCCNCVLVWIATTLKCAIDFNRVIHPCVQLPK